MLGMRFPAIAGRTGDREVHVVMIDAASRRVWVRDSLLSLTWTEFEILSLLASVPMRCFSKSEITRHVWERDYFYDGHTIESHISRLRRKLRHLDPGRTWITTVRRAGYRLDAADDGSLVLTQERIAFRPYA
jgi:DNA-binding response OmpR family regulator